MRAGREVTLAVVGWVVVAVAGAVLVWGVVSRAGEGVSGDLDPVPRAGQGAAPSESSDRPSSTPSSPSPSSSPSPATPGPAAPATNGRTWQGAVGVVSAECAGSAVRLTEAQPRSGYSVEVDDTGPDRVRVEFETDEERTRVEAVCVNTIPVFTEDRSGEG